MRLAAGLIGVLIALFWLGPCAAASGQVAIEPRVILQTGHAGRLTTAAWSADGQHVMTGSWDRQLLLWDLQGRIVDRAALPGIVAGYLTVVLIQPHEGGATVQVTIEGFENPGHDRRTYEWSFGRGVVETTQFAKARRNWDRESSQQSDLLASADGLISPDGRRTLTAFTAKGAEPTPYVRIRIKDGAGETLPLVGQSGLSDGVLGFLADPVAGAASPADLAVGAAFVRRASRDDDIFSARRLNFALSPDGWSAVWFDRTGAGAGAMQVFDFQKSALIATPVLDTDYDIADWLSPRKLAIRSTLTAAPTQILDIDSGALSIAGPALCNAVVRRGDLSVIGSGVTNCRRPHCAEPGPEQHCPPGPPDGLWIASADGALRQLDTTNLPPDGYYEGPQADGSPPPRRIITGISLSRDGRLAAVNLGREEPPQTRLASPEQAPDTYAAAIWDLGTGKRVSALQQRRAQMGNLAPIGPVYFAMGDTAVLALGSGEAETVVVNVFAVKTGGWLRVFSEPAQIMIPNKAGKLVKAIRDQTIDVGQFDLTPDGKAVAILDSGGDTRVLDIATGKRMGKIINLPADAVGFGADPVRPLYWTQASTGIVTFHSPRTGAVALSLYTLPQQRFIVTDGKGRYDSNLPPDSRALRWQMADAPLQSLAPQTFMRFLYEPRLASRFLDCTHTSTCGAVFRPAPAVLSLNRVLPQVSIDRVSPGPAAELAIVEISVRQGEDAGAVNGKTRSGAYDLRLFRDGALVAESPNADAAGPGAVELALWRRQSGLQLGADGVAHARFTVRLPTGADRELTRFTAYAFNEDRVKGETVEAVYKRPATTPRQRRALVLTIGENVYDNPAWTLNYAAADAQLIARRLATMPGYAVTPVTLISDGSARQATKAGIREALAGIARQATPDDVVIVSFSGHGWASVGGDFYLVPSDGDVDASGQTPRLASLISSAELTDWMRGIDAGEIAVIIDACHSAASVEAQGFKAGPFGDAGLGQLAFDKGIRILAGAQADAVAMEDAGLRQGLLTYVLAREALDEGDPRVGRGAMASPLGADGQVALDAWLRYAAHRLPSFSQQMAVARMSPAVGQRGLAFDPPLGAAAAPPSQEPSLFDFTDRPSLVRLSSPTRGATP